MTLQIDLPNDVERDILAAIDSGRFPTIDAALIEAWRSFQRQQSSEVSPAGDGFIGALRDDAAVLDQAVEHAMKVREERPFRLNAGE